MQAVMSPAVDADTCVGSEPLACGRGASSNGFADLVVGWVAARADYRSSPAGNAPPQGLMVAGPLLGVMCLAFGVGARGADWIARLARSAWFAGLEPWADDLATAGGAPAGCWTTPAGNAGRGSRIAAAVEAHFARASLPKAPLAMVAVPHGAGFVELAAALGLVAALRNRRGAGGCRMAVVVTVEAEFSPADSALERGLLDRGAFVVRAGLDAGGDHLHHFPLRAAVTPRRGRLVCTDLADHLACWRPGATADLHVIPADPDDALLVLGRLPVVASARGNGIRALNLHLNLDLDVAGDHLVALDRLATHCRGLLLGPEDDMVVTTTDRLDGITGLADLLVVHGRQGRALKAGAGSLL